MAGGGRRRGDQIAAFTISGAYANFLEDDRQALEVGKSADLVVLREDILRLPAERIHEAAVELTVFRGRPSRAAPSPGSPSTGSASLDERELSTLPKYPLLTRALAACSLERRPIAWWSDRGSE